MEGAVRQIKINDLVTMHFVYVPENMHISNVAIDGHTCDIIGRLKSFNRLKVLKPWKEKYPNLVKTFTDTLIGMEWDFEKHPNPVMFLTRYEG